MSPLGDALARWALPVVLAFAVFLAVVMPPSPEERRRARRGR